MTVHMTRLVLAVLLIATPTLAQRGGPPEPLPPGQSNDPFPTPIAATEGVIRVGVREFATLPDIAGVAARMMNLVNEPGTRRLFVNDMRGPIYSVSHDGKAVSLYLDINDAAWGVSVQSMGRERGFQSFTFHPQFAQPGTRGFGKFYTYTDTTNQTPAADFTTSNPATTHDTVMLEWTAKTPSAATYDGGAPRELFRLRQPFANHNAGHMAFDPLVQPDSPDFGLLYIGVADGGSGGDPMRLGQNLGSAFGKILRIDPLGMSSANKKYGIPASNPFVKTAGALPEIYAYGVRNPQRFAWDARNRNLFLADIGQNIVEEISLVTPGANLGWNDWEGSFRFIGRQAVSLEQPRSDPKVTYPIAEWGQTRSASPVQLRRQRSGRLSGHADPAAGESGDLHRHAERRDLLRQRRQAASRRTGRHSPHPAQLERIRQDDARGDSGEEQGAGQVAGDAIRPATQCRARQPGVPAEQRRRHHPGADAVRAGVRSPRPSPGRCAKTLQRLGLVLEDLEDVGQPCDVHQMIAVPGQVQELHRAAVLPR